MVPVNEAGCLIDPPVSLPRDTVHKFAAIAADDPPEDPGIDDKWEPDIGDVD